MLTFTFSNLTFLKSLTGGQPTICALKMKKTAIYILVNMDNPKQVLYSTYINLHCEWNTHMEGGRSPIFLQGYWQDRPFAFSLSKLGSLIWNGTIYGIQGL